MKSKRNRILWSSHRSLAIGHAWEYVELTKQPGRDYYIVLYKERGKEIQCIGGSTSPALLLPVAVDKLNELQIIDSTRKSLKRLTSLSLNYLGHWAVIQ